MQHVFVIDQNKQPLMPCRPARARALLKQGLAAVYQRYPFTIILRERQFLYANGGLSLDRDYNAAINIQREGGVCTSAQAGCSA